MSGHIGHNDFRDVGVATYNQAFCMSKKIELLVIEFGHQGPRTKGNGIMASAVWEWAPQFMDIFNYVKLFAFETSKTGRVSIVG